MTKKRKHQTAILYDKNNKFIMGIRKTQNMERTYRKPFFDDDRPPTYNKLEEDGCEITKNKVVYAIKLQKNGKKLL